MHAQNCDLLLIPLAVFGHVFCALNFPFGFLVAIFLHLVFSTSVSHTHKVVPTPFLSPLPLSLCTVVQSDSQWSGAFPCSTLERGTAALLRFPCRVMRICFHFLPSTPAVEQLKALSYLSAYFYMDEHCGGLNKSGFHREWHY